MSCCVSIPNRNNWWSTEETNISQGVLFRLKNYMSRKMFEGIVLPPIYINSYNVEYNYGIFRMIKLKEACIMNKSG